MEDVNIYVVCYENGSVAIVPVSFLPYEERKKSQCFLRMRVPASLDLTALQRSAQRAFSKMLAQQASGPTLSDYLRDALKDFGIVGSVEYRITQNKKERPRFVPFHQ